MSSHYEISSILFSSRVRLSHGNRLAYHCHAEKLVRYQLTVHHVSSLFVNSRTFTHQCPLLAPASSTQARFATPGLLWLRSVISPCGD